MTLQKLHYENMGGMLIRREGVLHWRCPDCKAEGESGSVMKTCPQCHVKPAKAAKPVKATTLDSTGTTAVDRNYFWRPISTCPRGAKVQLLGKGGVAMYGTYTGKETFYTHWAPLPKLPKEKHNG